MAASYPKSIKSFLTYQDQPGSNNIVTDPDKPGSTVDLTITRAKATNEIHDEVIAMEKTIGITGPKFTVIPGTGSYGNEINALYNGKATGQIDPSNNAIYPGSPNAHNHVHAQMSDLGADVHPQYMRVDGSRGFNAPVFGQPAAASNQLATWSQVEGAGYLTPSQVEFVIYTTIRSEADYPCIGMYPQVEPLRYRMTGGCFNGRTDANGNIRIDYSSARFIGILTFVFMKLPFSGVSASGYTYQYEEDQLLLQSIDNQGCWIQFAEDIVVDRQANVALTWMVVGV